MAELAEGHRIPKSRLKSAITELSEFDAQVTYRLTKEGARRRVPARVTNASAVEKAASDKDRRVTRHDILVTLLRPYFTGG